MAFAAEAVFLEGEGFLSGEALDEEFVADDLLVMNPEGSALRLRGLVWVWGRLGRYREDRLVGDAEGAELFSCRFQKGLRSQSLGVGIGDLDDDQSAAQRGGGGETLDLWDADPDGGGPDAESLPGEFEKRGDLPVRDSQHQTAVVGELDQSVADLPPSNGVNGKSVFAVNLR